MTTQQTTTQQTTTATRTTARRQDSILSRDVILIMAAAFFYMGSSMLVTPIIVGYAHRIGASGELAGLIAGGMYVVSLFCRPVAGNLSDTMPKRRLVGIGAACLIAANVMYALSPNPAVLAAARAINGVGFSCVSVCLATWMVSLIPLSHVGKAMGVYGTVNALAMAVGPALGIKVEQTFGYRGSFIASTAMMILMAVSVMLVRNGGDPRKPPTHGTQPGHADAGRLRTLLDHVVAVNVIPVAVVFMLFAIPYCATQSYIVTYVRVRHLAVEVSLFFPLYAAALLVMRIAMRNLFDRLSFAWFLTVGSLAMAATMAALALMRDDWGMLLAAILMAASYGLMSSVSQAAAVRIAGPGRSGQANATYYVGIDLGMSLGPIIGGLLYASLPAQWLFPTLAACVPLAVVVYLLFGRRAERTAVSEPDSRR
ncbi:MFS transporter [Bifidobacterium leontopitheci]|uniref:Multidrug resistance protein B n=1 Tax=Bifidobacterium leontopitheci TaxID=2650774 RepID=A0A6I1GGJ3_9BIFI|nr:MFS transporter [Bifidobacterium leontopitheci]KAB7790695.1 multidrug resistance protein B [Bifidobacterium leontopitheci]